MYCESATFGERAAFVQAMIDFEFRWTAANTAHAPGTSLAPAWCSRSRVRIDLGHSVFCMDPPFLERTQRSYRKQSIVSVEGRWVRPSTTERAPTARAPPQNLSAGLLVSGFRFWVLNPKSSRQGSYFRILGLGFRVSSFGFQVSGVGCRMQGFGLQVSGVG